MTINKFPISTVDPLGLPRLSGIPDTYVAVKGNQLYRADAGASEFANRAAAEGAVIPAPQIGLTVVHDGIACRYRRDDTSTALYTNGGTVAWGPDPAFWAFLQHYGVTTYASITEALAAGAAMTSGQRAAEQDRLEAAFGETGGDLVIIGFVEVYDKLILSPARTVRLARDPARDGLVVSSRFNMSATSIVQGGTLASDGADIASLHIWADQPASPANRAALTQYPRAVDIAGITRGRIGYLRLSAVWDGLIGDGNCGGWDIGTVEYGAFSRGVVLDGAQDNVRVERLHAWRYGFVSNGTLQAIHDDGTTEALRVGRMDGLVIESALVYRAKVVVDDETGVGLRVHIKSLMLDGDRANLELGRGKSLITLAYGTEALSSPQLSYKVICTAGEHVIENSDLVSDATPTVEVTGGQLTFSGKIFNSNLTIGQGATVTGGTLVLDGARLAWPTGARSVPFVEQSSTGTLVMLDCAVEADTAGEAVRFNTDQPGNYVDRARFGQHTVTMPSGAHRGNYGRNQRADLVARCADGWRAVAGEVIYADGLAYVGSAGATTISDLPGLLPHGPVAPDHFGGKTRTAISAAWTYWNTLCTTSINSDVPASTAVAFRFVAGQYNYDSTSALSLETAGSRQRAEWAAGAISRGLSIRLRTRWCELIDPYIIGGAYDMDYGVAYQPDEGVGLRGAYLQNPKIIGIQNAAKTACGVKVYGNATHMSVLGGRLYDSDYNFWWDNRADGDGVSGVLMTGTHLLGARVNNIRGGSISESKFNNLRVRQAAQEGVLLTPTSAGENLLECYFADCSITGNHTDLTTRASYAITGITDNGSGKARLAVDLSGEHLLWAGLNALSMGGTGIAAYDASRKFGITAITSTYVDIDLDFAGNATGTLYHCGWDVKLEGTEPGGTPLLARVNDVQFTGGNINSLGLFYCYNVSFTGTRLKVNAFAKNCNRITRVGGFRGRAEEVSDEPVGGAWADVPIVGQATGIFEIGQSVGTSATRDTVPTGVMRMPLSSAGLTHNRPNAYSSVGVNSSTGAIIDGPLTTTTTPIPADAIGARLGWAQAKPFVIVVEGQSNAVGNGTGQSTTINQTGGGIFIYSSLTGGSGGSMVAAAYGNAPLNLALPSGTTATPANARANIGVHIANRIRELGLIAPSRPIWIMVNAVGGINISEWVDSPYTREVAFADGMAAMSTLYGSTLTVDHLHWQQGEANSTTAPPYNTDATYIAAWDAYYTAKRASIYWGAETTITIGEILQSRPFVSSDTASLMRPANARNTALRQIALRNPKVALVKTGDLTANGLLAADQNHFGGAGLETIGRRVGDALVALRAGAVTGAHVQADAEPSIEHPYVAITSETVYLGTKDIDTGTLHLRCAAATVHLPLVQTGHMPTIFVDVWSVSGGETVINPPAGTTIDGPTGLVSSVSLPIGKYVFWLSGRWQFAQRSPIRGDFLLRAPANMSAGQVLGLTQQQARGVVINAFGGGAIGLPSPEQGAMITIIKRSTTSGGTTTIGRACAGVTIASGGSGYAVGDTIQCNLGGATGTAPTVTVTAVSAGVITDVDLTDPACITTSTDPTNPVSQASTSGSGTGATFNLSYSSAAILGPRITDSAHSYALTTVNQLVHLEASGPNWWVVSDNAQNAFYSSGTFTPGFSNSVPGDLSVTGVTASGIIRYMGAMAWVAGEITCTATHTTASGYWQITGLPAFLNNNNFIIECTDSAGISYPSGQSDLVAINGVAASGILRLRTGSNQSDLPIANVASGTPFTLRFAGWLPLS